MSHPAIDSREGAAADDDWDRDYPHLDRRPPPLRDIDRGARFVVGLVVAIALIAAAVHIGARVS